MMIQEIQKANNDFEFRFAFSNWQAEMGHPSKRPTSAMIPNDPGSLYHDPSLKGYSVPTDLLSWRSTTVERTCENNWSFEGDEDCMSCMSTDANPGSRSNLLKILSTEWLKWTFWIQRLFFPLGGWCLALYQNRHTLGCLRPTDNSAEHMSFADRQKLIYPGKLRGVGSIQIRASKVQEREDNTWT